MYFGFTVRDSIRDPEKNKVNIKAVDGLTVDGFIICRRSYSVPGAVFLCPSCARFMPF